MSADGVFEFWIKVTSSSERSRMSRASLAKRLDVSKETVYRYEDNLQDPALNRMKRNNGLRSTSLYGCLFITDSGV